MLKTILTPKEIRKSNASDFPNGTNIMVVNEKTREHICYIAINGRLHTTVTSAKTFKFLDCTPGTRGGWPYYIADFIYR